MSGDPIFEIMKARGLPLTRETYLNLNFMGKPPAVLHLEIEQEMPEELREPDDIPDPASEFDRILFVLVQERE